MAILVFVVVDRLWLRPQTGVDLEDYVIATVERGALAIEVQGAGELEPVNERLIASEVAGTVERIYVRAGERIEVGDEIVRLINPQIRQGVVAARLQVAEARADHQRRLAELTDRRLSGEANILAKQAVYEESELQLKAQDELRKRQAISEIDFKRTQIRTELSKTDLEFERRRFNELETALGAEQASSEARVAARESALNEAERLEEGLLVKSDIAGTVRDVPIEAGERISAGTQVARVVDAESLKGIIRVPETYAGRLVTGQTAVATVMKMEVAAIVSRVDPAVSQNSVAIDLEFVDPLPRGVRPDLSIRATVTVTQLEDVLFVRRPLSVNDDSTAQLFMLGDDGKSAVRTVVRFGMGTLKEIEVVGGLTEGDEIIVGDTRRFENVDRIEVR